MLEEIISAIHAYFKAHRFIVQHKLWKWILIPGVIYCLLFITGIYFFWESAAFMLEFLFSRLGVKAWLQRENAGWLNFIFLFSRIVMQLTLLLIYFSWFKYLFLIIGSPLFAWLSEKTEAILLQKEYPFRLQQFLSDIARGVSIALRNTFWQTVYTASIFIVALIPVAGWVTPVLALFVECYYLGFSMLDYTNERKGISATASISLIGRHKGLAIGNGMVFYLVHLMPVIGWVLAPGYAVIAATISLQNNSESTANT